MIDFTINKTILEQLYTDKCTIYNRENVRDENTHITKQEWVVYKEDIPCRLSSKSISTVDSSSDYPIVRQEIKLFLSPDVEIKAGSKIEVTHLGETKIYKKSSTALIYENHQELNIDLQEKDW